MKKFLSYFLVCCFCWLGIPVTLLFNSCINPTSSSLDSPQWVTIKTGLLTDSIKKPPDTIDEEEFAKKINTSGFEVTWKRVRDADYYEIRTSKSNITPENWHKATLTKTVKNIKKSEITTTINKLQPKIIGNNCTGCEACLAVCPLSAITISKNKAVIDLDVCTGCGRCFNVCNFSAITDNFLGEFYYFAIRAFSEDGTPSHSVRCTDHSYALLYKNFKHLIVINPFTKKKIKIHWCGHCKEACYVLNPHVVGGKGFDNGGCPVSAVYFTENPRDSGAIFIDQSKCIYCGKCVLECGKNTGKWSIRRVIVSTE